MVYFSEDSVGTNRSYLGNVPVGVNVFRVPADIEPAASVTHLVIYAQSKLTEGSTPKDVLIFDRSASVSNISFHDHDLDEGEICGNLSWVLPSSLERVLGYRFYLAGDAAGLVNRSQIEQEVSAYTDLTLVSTETPLSTHTHLVVYTRSVLLEQTTPVAFEISDTVFTVVNVSFPDFDLDLFDLGGTVSWDLASDDTQVTHYNVYFAEECEATVLGDEVAIVRGSMTFQLEGATMAQVESAVKATLAAALGLDERNIIVTVTRSTSRLLSPADDDGDSQSGRRLTTTWTVSYQAVVSLAQSAAVVSAAQAASMDTSQVASILQAKLIAVGVDPAALSSLVVQSFSRLSPLLAPRARHQMALT
jgi:hypothetical protein